MGADRAADRHADDRSQSGFPTIRLGAAFWGTNRRLWQRAELLVLSTDVQSLWKYQRHTHRDTWLSTWRCRGWLRQPAERLAHQRRPRAGADGPCRLQHQRERYDLVSIAG